MKKLFAALLALTMALSTAPVFAVEPAQEEVKADKKIITYLPCWESRPWDLEDIQGDKLTHIYLSFARINNNFEISNDEMRIHIDGADGRVALPDIVSADMIIPETWDKVTAIKEKYPDLKVIVAVGGWEAAGFSEMASSPASREIFVDSVVKYIEEHKLDGIDLDWEYPVNGAWGVITSSEEDKDNFTELIKLLRQKLGEDKEISFCASVSGWFMDVIDWEQVLPLVNSVNIMAYDMHGAWDTGSFHSAPLYRNPADPLDWGLSVAETFGRFEEKGIPADKIIMGIPAYGKEYKNIVTGPNGDGLFQPFVEDAPKTSWVGGSIPYAQLKNYYVDKNGFTRYWDDIAKVPYLYDGKTFISYEDADSVKGKCEFVNEKGMAGVMYWEYVNDIDGDLLNVMSETLK